MQTQIPTVHGRALGERATKSSSSSSVKGDARTVKRTGGQGSKRRAALGDITNKRSVASDGNASASAFAKSAIKKKTVRTEKKHKSHAGAKNEQIIGPVQSDRRHSPVPPPPQLPPMRPSQEVREKVDFVFDQQVTAMDQPILDGYAPVEVTSRGPGVSYKDFIGTPRIDIDIDGNLDDNLDHDDVALVGNKTKSWRQYPADFASSPSETHIDPVEIPPIPDSAGLSPLGRPTDDTVADNVVNSWPQDPYDIDSVQPLEPIDNDIANNFLNLPTD